MDELKDGMKLNPELNAKLDDHELEYKKTTSTLMKGYHDWESKGILSKRFFEKDWWRAAQSYCFAEKSNSSKPEFIDFLDSLTAYFCLIFSFSTMTLFEKKL